METWLILLQLSLVLLAARFFGELAARWRFPAILGELAAGIIIGPSVLGLVTPNEVLELLAEIGIILLLFEVGLDSDFERLMEGGRTALVVALVGFVAPFALVYGLSYYTFDLPILLALFVAGTMTATSIGITVRVLAELGRAGSREGRIVLGAAVVDDLLGVFLLAILLQVLSNGHMEASLAARLIGTVAAFFLLGPLVARALSPLLERLHRSSDHPGLMPSVLVSMVLGFAAVAHLMGVPEILGGFIAGIALSRRFFLPFAATMRTSPEFTATIHRQMEPIIHLFTPIFFVTVGLSMDLRSVDWSSTFVWVFSLSIFVAGIAGKLAGGLVAFRYSSAERVAIGMAMVPRGEVGLVFAELGRFAGILDNGTHATVVLIIAYTTLLTPFWLKLYYRRHGHDLEPWGPYCEWPRPPQRQSARH